MSDIDPILHQYFSELGKKSAASRTPETYKIIRYKRDLKLLPYICNVCHKKSKTENVCSNFYCRREYGKREQNMLT